MKKLIFLMLLSLLFILNGCSDKTPNPTDQLQTYIDHWTNYEFEDMYKMLSEDVKDTYSTADFIERYEKIYDDLEIEQLKINHSTLSDEEIAQYKEDGIASFTLDIEMESIAGPIKFSSDIKLHLMEEEDETKNWNIEWNPGLIFPELADGGVIKIEVESPRRGEILDRNQMPLAINDIAYEIGVVPEQFQSEQTEKERIATLLNMSVAAIDEKLNEAWVRSE